MFSGGAFPKVEKTLQQNALRHEPPVGSAISKLPGIESKLMLL